MNEKNLVSINQAAYDEVKKLLAPCTGPSMSAAQPVPLGHQITQGRQHDEVNSWKISQLLGSHAIAQSALQYTYGFEYAQPPPMIDKGKKKGS
jgi:hypothetical protein